MQGISSILALVAIGATPAMAATAPSQPAECPPGSRGVSDDRGGYCVTMRCINDGSCPPDAGYSCEPNVGVCVETRRVRCPDDPTNADCMVDVEVALGSCAQPGQCAAGSCRIRPLCVKADINLLWLLLLVGGTLVGVVVFFVVNRRRTRPSI